MILSDSRAAGPQPIVRVDAAEAVFPSMRNAIESGELPVVSKPDAESVLAAQCAVSRSVIREALRSCAALGLARTRTGKGTFVIAPRAGGDPVPGSFPTRSPMEARPHIEIPAARLAAARATDQLLQLRGIIEATEVEDDPETPVTLDAGFHATIAAASGNGVCVCVVNDIRDAMANQSGTINLITVRQHPSHAGHREILAAIGAGDGPAAGKAMAAHMAAVDEAPTLVLGADKP